MFHKQNMQARLITAFIFMGVLVFLVSLIGWMGSARLSQTIRIFSKNSFPSTVALWKISEGQTQIQSADRALLNSAGDADYRSDQYSRIEDAWKQIEDGFQSYNKLARDSEEDRLYKAFLPLFETWKNLHEESKQLSKDYDKLGVINAYQTQINLLRQGKNDAPELAKAKAAADILDKLTEQTMTTKRSAFNDAKRALRQVQDYNRGLAEKADKAGVQAIDTTRMWMIGAMVLAPAVAIILGIYFSNMIAKPLGAKIAGVVEAAQRIANGDLTTKVPVSEQHDEVGRLQSAFHRMNQDLNALIRQVQHSGIQITTSATQIAASGKQLEATVNEQVASTNEVVATAKEISATSTQLVKTMDRVSTKSEATAQSASSGQKDLAMMATTMSGLAEATGTISIKLGIISEKANNINSIVTTITKVADQTNLLSLNAAIEAEKAGEYGTGFAVVAREIRRLADQTAVATLDIENMVKEMQSAVSVGVMEMDKFTKDVSQGVKDIRLIGDQLADAIEQVQALTPEFEVVNQGMEEQANGAQQISEAMEQLSEASLQTADALRDINGAIAQLNEAAQHLRHEISRFKVAA